ncbi:helix-turn-helix domain-containing protein [Streptomyces clavuligerus]|uniref:DNA-binding protein n=1 Tax=Streptomyces clavuligerus TaxID=1901 RepID=B5GLM2_STRCL|nr:helix-turn-helix transcriptional regulator [Streptomyces clavuligerus]EDY47218.1 DNA-binding protein [Streptomyces clavuligerus]EFG04885.1 DNA-binding protein [Streptomyces clavuligerus]MBY6306676.1 helix-turn-helix domain-containing protein [Streptomyces clavuligerus]QCS10717.1 XRE family transcriptional regulator [Streptomyces clavuligerus]QPJ97247.1 helix-turn-helix domain-containing protein [Streptomyces clavuligerus]
MDKHGLAAFLRNKREQTRPEDVGVPRGPRRRTPGLRREEVAELAHISIDHYNRLEQARGRNPSPQVLQAIAHALRLSDQERSHLFSLAGEREDDRSRLPSRAVAPATALLLDRLTDTPALVVDNTCRVVAWNRLAGTLFGDFSALPTTDRSLLRGIFLSPDSERGPHGLSDPRGLMAGAVGYLRVATTRYPDSAELHGLIAELRADSPAFAELWDSYQLHVDHHAREVFRHPQIGEIELDFDVLTVPDRDQQMVIFTAEPGSSAYRNLQLLNVVDTQDG